MEETLFALTLFLFCYPLEWHVKIVALLVLSLLMIAANWEWLS